MKLVLSLACALLLAADVHYAVAQPPPVELRLMTYNIQAGGGNLEGIAEVIRSSGATLVALQEVDVHWDKRSDFADQATELSRLLGLQVRFAPIYRLPGADSLSPPREYGVALLSRHPIVAFTNHAITRLSTQGNDASPTPMPGFLEVTIDVRGQRVRVFNTHLDYRGDPAVRRQQVSESLAIIGDAATPVLMFGDLNAVPTAPELQPLFTRLHDGWPDSAGTGFTYPAAKPVRRIDYVLASAHVRVIFARVLDAQASDHRPVVMDVVIR
ncbi:MAG: endonuclease/exonuclease/phosphatase family protein [Gemmatimonadaceae bacterium]|nr:endonuclease/exonuclease/phosphatase family protein [Gemmatimonadaceae bacterium]